MNASILFLLAISRAYHHGVLVCQGLAIKVAPPLWIGACDTTVTITGLSHPRPIKANLVGRCKKCRAGACVRNAVQCLATYQDRNGNTHRDDVAVADGAVLVGSIKGGFLLPCECGARINVARVAGKVSHHVCNAKCMSSTGPACECSCGGKNHGSAHA